MSGLSNIDLFLCCRHCIALSNILEFHTRGWYNVNADHFVLTLRFRNCLYLPTTQCACAEFEDFAKQYNGGGGGGCEKDLLVIGYCYLFITYLSRHASSPITMQDIQRWFRVCRLPEQN
jgi:hypothetical protein